MEKGEEAGRNFKNDAAAQGQPESEPAGGIRPDQPPEPSSPPRREVEAGDVLKSAEEPRQDATGESPAGAQGGQTAAKEGKRPTWARFQTTPGLYKMLLANQKGAEGWANRGYVPYFDAWGCSFIKDLDLRVKDGTYLGMPLIKIERMNVRTLGLYRAAADGYAIAGTIIVNEERLRGMTECEMLVLLLKCLVCAWRHQKIEDDAIGRKQRCDGECRFDQQCRDKMKEMGVEITAKGDIRIKENGEFRQLLEKEGINVPEKPEFKRPERAGKTTLQVWSCRCPQRARVGTSEFHAVCTQCNEPFRPGDFLGAAATA